MGNDPAKRAAGQLGEYAYSGQERSASELVQNIVTNAQQIIRSEVRLAKAELREESKKALAGSAALATGGVLALFGLGFLLAAATAGLALVIPWWAAALIVGFVLAVAGGAGIAAGIKTWRTVHAPEKTIQDVKENVEWLKQQTRS
jgi:uncharacterized membrane protein YqjE